MSYRSFSYYAWGAICVKIHDWHLMGITEDITFRDTTTVGIYEHLYS